MIPMLNFPLALGAVALGCTVLLAAACGTAGEPSSTQPGQLKVVTAFYPLQFVAERVAGQHGAVSSLTQPGAEPHDVELTPRQVASVTDADAVVYIEGFQPAVDEAVAQSGNEHVLDTTGEVPVTLPQRLAAVPKGTLWLGPASAVGAPGERGPSCGLEPP